MPVQYAGGNLNATAVCATKTDILNFLETNLTAAPGWTVISGSGTSNRLFQTQTTPQGLALRVRAKDNGGTCIQISIESTDGTKVGGSSINAGGSMVPGAGFSWRLLANKYQFFAYVAANYTSTHMCVYAGCPYIPSPNAVPTRAGIMMCDSESDTTATQRPSWRTSLAFSNINNTVTGNQQILWANTIWEYANTGTNLQWQSLSNLWLPMPIGGGGGTLQSGNIANRRFVTGDDITADAFLQFAVDTYGGEPFVCAQAWDSLVVYNSFPGETSMVFNAHNWLTPTNSNVGTAGTPLLRGSYFFVVP